MSNTDCFDSSEFSVNSLPISHNADVEKGIIPCKLDVSKTTTKLDEAAIIEKAAEGLRRYAEVNFEDGLDDSDADKMQTYYHTLRMRLHQGKVSAKRLERLVVNILDEFVNNGLRDGHWFEPVEQVLCTEVTILVDLVEAELATKNT